MSCLKYLWVLLVSAGSFSVAFCQTDTARRAESTRVQKNIIPKAVQTAPVKYGVDSAAAVRATDSTQVQDSIRTATLLRDSLLADSIRKASLSKPLVPLTDTSTYRKYETHPYLPLHQPAVYMLIDYHEGSNKDDLFYLMAGVVLLLAFIRAVFSKYFRNVFLLFFQTSLRQKQTRDQLLQNNLASLLTNFLFLVSAGLYITLLIRYHHWTDLSFWWIAAGSGSVLLLVYLAKYLFLLFTGWVFNTKEAAGSYVFVVFLVNKILGVVLVPFLLVIAFASAQVVQVAITLSIGMVALLFAYRYWVSFVAVRTKLKVNALHFLLYLCAVELLPLVLIYKVLINYFSGTA